MTDEPIPAIARRASVTLRHDDGHITHATVDALYTDVIHAAARHRLNQQPLHLRTTAGQPLEIHHGQLLSITELAPEPWPW